MSKQKKKGFTLIELLAVIVVLAIILVIAVPKILEVIENAKVLHSVLEYKYKNKFYIIDYTKNIIMPKEQYIKLTKFKEIERISDLEYIEDLGKICNFPYLTDKVYVTFKKELIRELECKGLFVDDEISKKEIQE